MNAAMRSARSSVIASLLARHGTGERAIAAVSPPGADESGAGRRRSLFARPGWSGGAPGDPRLAPPERGRGPWRGAVGAERERVSGFRSVHGGLRAGDAWYRWGPYLSQALRDEDGER